MKYIQLKRAAEECVTALDNFLNGNQYAGVDGEAIMKEVKEILESGLKNERERGQEVKDVYTMDERTVLQKLAELLWNSELENTKDMKLLERKNYLMTKHPLGRAGLQQGKDGVFLTLLINGEFFEVFVQKSEVV